MSEHVTAHSTRIHVPRTTPASQPSPVRLTRRGRVVVLLTLLSLLLVAFSLGRSAHSEAAGPAATQGKPAYAQTTVHQGETLWSVARRIAPGHDPRATVERIRELNNLDSASVRAGQLLVVPKKA
jgi:hypothetical protein